jgi:hypothetical protein
MLCLNVLTDESSAFDGGSVGEGVILEGLSKKQKLLDPATRRGPQRGRPAIGHGRPGPSSISAGGMSDVPGGLSEKDKSGPQPEWGSTTGRFKKNAALASHYFGDLVPG